MGQRLPKRSFQSRVPQTKIEGREGSDLRGPQTELGLLDFRQDGRVGIRNLHIIVLFQVGIAERRWGKNAWPWGRLLFLVCPETILREKGIDKFI